MKRVASLNRPTMKNRIEEKAREYAQQERTTRNEQIAFAEGATWMQSELTRWRDAREELPEEGNVVLAKVHCENADNINYQVAAYVKEPNVWITAVHSDVGIPQYFDLVEYYMPTHWLPIPEFGKEVEE